MLPNRMDEITYMNSESGSCISQPLHFDWKMTESVLSCMQDLQDQGVRQLYLIGSISCRRETELVGHNAEEIMYDRRALSA